MSSKEGLVTIFEEMKRRWDVGEKRRGEEKGEGEKEREREGRRIVRGSKVRYSTSRKLSTVHTLRWTVNHFTK